MGANTLRELSDANGAFSGADIIANIIFPGCTPIAIGSASTITYSTYRETTPVRTLSRINVKGFSRGQRTIAGTIIFTVLKKHIVNELKTKVPYLSDIKKLKPDELPPFDILFTMGNEYGTKSHMALYGVSVVDEGKIFSIEDMFTENTWSYMARDIDLMDDIDSYFSPPTITLGEYDGTGSYDKNKLVLDDDYVKMQKELDKMKSDRDALINELRQQAHEYISSPTGWVPGDDIIIMPPGGTNTHEPGNGDTNVDEENHTKFEIKFLKNHPTNDEPDDINAYCTLDVLNSNNFSSAEKKLKAADVRLVATMSDKVCGKLTSQYKLSSTKLTAKYVNFQKHTPSTPTITIGVNKKEFVYDGTTYVLQGEQTFTIQNPTSLTKDKPFKFVYAAKGSKDDTADDYQDLKFELNFTQNSFKSIPGVHTPSSNQMFQYIFRYATSNALIGDPPLAAAGNVHQPTYYTVMTLFDDDITKAGAKDVVSKIKPEKLVGSFNMKGKVTSGGKSVTPKNLKKMEVRCNYRCTCTSKVYGEIILDGSNTNNNVITSIQNTFSPIWDSLKYGGTFPLENVLNGMTLYPMSSWDGQPFKFVTASSMSGCIADQIVTFTHMHYDCEDYSDYEYDPRTPFKKHSKKQGKDKCLCGISHNKLTFELYNFRLVDTATNKEVQNSGAVKSIFFRIINMDDAVLKALS